MKTNNIYEVNTKPNNGCLTAIILFIICLIFGFMTSCKKDECIQPNFKIDVDKSKFCAGCKPKSPLDTALHKQF
jgi:hypothetical protein